MMQNGVDRSHPGLRTLLHDTIEGAESERALLKTLPVLVRWFLGNRLGNLASARLTRLARQRRLVKGGQGLTSRTCTAQIRGGFDVNAMRRSDGITPLHIACALPRTTAFKVLVVLGADIHAVANDGSMPLNRAIAAAAAATSAAQVVSAGDMAAHLRSLGAEETVSLRSYRG